MRRAVGQGLGLLGGKLEATADRPGGGEVEDEGEDLPTASLRAGRLRRRAFGACGSLSRGRRRGRAADRPRRPFYETAAVKLRRSGFCFEESSGPGGFRLGVGRHRLERTSIRAGSLAGHPLLRALMARVEAQVSAVLQWDNLRVLKDIPQRKRWLH